MQTFKTIDNIRIAYSVYGDDSAPVVLMIMGLGMPSQAWPSHLIEQLVRQGLRVIVFDNRDSGQSTKIQQPVSSFTVFRAIIRTLLRRPVTGCYSLEDMAADAVGVLDQLRIKRAHIMGISMGAMIAQVLAYLYPQRVASLVSIMGASGNPRTGLGKFRAIKAVLSQPARPNDLMSMQKYLRKIFKAIGSPHHCYSDEQVEIANYLSSLGVQLIIGTHPHVVEPVEYINDGKTLVIYSLGNFISDQVGVERLTGLMMEVTINKVETEEGITVSVDSPKAELIYTDSNYGGKRNFKVYPYSKLDGSILSDYQNYYDEYKSVVSSRYPELVWGLSRS